jgi:hypothetical protein
MQTKLNTEQIEINGINQRMFINFFNIDDDFNEVAEKYSKEVFNLFCDKFYNDIYLDVLQEALEHCINMQIDYNNFILKSSICLDYDINIICEDLHENIYTCVISYMTN